MLNCLCADVPQSKARMTTRQKSASSANDHNEGEEGYNQDEEEKEEEEEEESEDEEKGEEGNNQGEDEEKKMWLIYDAILRKDEFVFEFYNFLLYEFLPGESSGNYTNVSPSTMHRRHNAGYC